MVQDDLFYDMYINLRFVNVVLPSFLGLQATFPRLEECQDTIADIQWFIADFFPV